tara:strand:- start:1110 stop:1919 length:810 start_codon:yes stop_codon:yes gene_type:complete
MQSLVIVIILLSLIGLYINLGSTSELNGSIFSKPLEDKNVYHNKGVRVGPEGTMDYVAEQQIPPKCDTTGNFLVENKKKGLTPGKELINLKVEKGSVPNTRQCVAGTKPCLTPYGLRKLNLSFKNNFLHDEKYCANISAASKCKSTKDTIARNSKPTPYIGRIALPQNESKSKERYSYTNRAFAVIKNQNANQNKNLPDIKSLNEEEINIRGCKKIHRVKTGGMVIKVKPNMTTINNKRDENICNEKLNNKHNEAAHSVSEMKKIYNFK